MPGGCLAATILVNHLSNRHAMKFVNCCHLCHVKNLKSSFIETPTQSVFRETYTEGHSQSIWQLFSFQQDFKVYGEWAKHRVANLLPLAYIPGGIATERDRGSF